MLNSPPSRGVEAPEFQLTDELLANFSYRMQSWTYLATHMARLNIAIIYNSYCLNERKHHLRDGLVGDAVVVSFSAKKNR